MRHLDLFSGIKLGQDLLAGNAFDLVVRDTLGKVSIFFRGLCYQQTSTHRFFCTPVCEQYLKPLFRHMTGKPLVSQGSVCGIFLGCRQHQFSLLIFGGIFSFFLLGLLVFPKTLNDFHEHFLLNNPKNSAICYFRLCPLRGKTLSRIAYNNDLFLAAVLFLSLFFRSGLNSISSSICDLLFPPRKHFHIQYNALLA